MVAQLKEWQKHCIRNNKFCAWSAKNKGCCLVFEDRREPWLTEQGACVAYATVAQRNALEFAIAQYAERKQAEQGNDEMAS
jgi:hypothetical protein